MAFVQKHLLFIGSIAFCIAFVILSFDGYYFYDDTTYAFYAYQISKGNFLIANSDIFAHRWGLILPLALIYKFLGINDFSTVLLPLLATLVSFSIFYFWVQKELPSPQKDITFLLFSLDFYTLFFANKLYPDVLITTTILYATILSWKRKNKLTSGVIWAVVVFLSFLCKETIFFALPFYIFLFIHDLLKRQNKLFWLGGTLGTLSCGVFYCACYVYFTGDPFFRFTKIQEAHQAYQQFRSDDFLSARLTYAPLLMFVQTGLIIPFAGALVAMFGQWNKKLQEFSNFNVWFFRLAVLSFWFLPVDFENYSPIYLLPRHILFIVPFGAIVSAEILCRKNYYILTAVLLLTASVIAYQSVSLKVSLLYLLISFWITLPCTSKHLLKTTLLGALLALHPIYTGLKNTETGYKHEKRLFEKCSPLFQKPCIVFTDDKLLSGYKWYFQFEPPAELVFRSFNEINKFAQSNLPQYAILNEYSIEYFSLIGYELPSWIRQIPNSWEKVFQEGKVHLYQIR